MAAIALGEVLGTAPLLRDLIQQIPARALKSRTDKKGLIDSLLANSPEKLIHDAKTMDNEMKICIGITIKLLNAVENLAWDTVIQSLHANPVLEPDGEGISAKDYLDFGAQLAISSDYDTPDPDDHKCQ